MTYTPVLGGLALNSGGISCDEIRDVPAVELEMETLLRGGSAVVRDSLIGRVIRLAGAVRAASGSALEGIADNLYQVLQETGEQVLQLADDRFLDVHVSADEYRVQPGASGAWVLWSATCYATSPYWRGAAFTNNTVTNTTSAPTKNVTVTGKAPTLPSYEITNGGTIDYTGITVTITNGTSGEEFRLFSFDLGAGDTLYVDADTGEVYIGSGSSADSAAPKRVDGMFFELLNGTTTLTFTHNFGTSGDITFKVKHYDRHHTLGDLTP